MSILPRGVTRTFGRTVLKAKKNSPHIFFAGGIVGVVGSTFLACRATLKLEATVDDIRHDLTKIKNFEVSEQERTRDLVYVYARSTGKIAKLYGPSVVLGGMSIAALTGSHVQMTRRNAALTAAFTAVTQAFDEYRARVQEEIGEEKELDIYRGIKDIEIDKDGKKKKVKGIDALKGSPYARIYDDKSFCWHKDPEYNRIFLQAQQNYANDLLHSRGHVFLNEVYDSLGLERSREGQVVGWLIGNPAGDGHIDFGLYEAYNKTFTQGSEPSLILDFNVDGLIHDKI